MTNTWYHVPATKSASMVRMFINGTQVGAAVSGASIGNRYNLTIGAAVNGVFYFPGYLDEIRIRKGVAMWTGSFTPPGTPYLP